MLNSQPVIKEGTIAVRRGPLSVREMVFIGVGIAVIGSVAVAWQLMSMAGKEALPEPSSVATQASLNLPAFNLEVLRNPHFLELEKVRQGCWEGEGIPCPPLGREDPFAPL